MTVVSQNGPNADDSSLAWENVDSDASFDGT